MRRATTETPQNSSTRASTSRTEWITPSVRARIDAIAAAFRERGARPLDAEWSAFVAPGDARVSRVRIERAQCLGLVAVGPAALRKLSLRVHDASGVLLGEQNDAHPYLRLCVRNDARITVVVRALEGQGQVALLLLAQPPLVAPDLDRALGERPVGVLLTGQRTPRAAVGVDPTVESVTDVLARHRARVGALGYRPLGSPYVTELERSATLERTFEFEAGRCYGVLIASEGSSESLTVELRDPDGRPLIVQRSVDRDPLTRGCLSQTGRYTLRLTARESLRVALQSLILDDRLSVAEDIVGEVRAGVLELHGEALTRSLREVKLIERVASVGAPLVRSLFIDAGQCVLVGAATSGAGVELSLNEPSGALIASDTGASSTPRIWHCASQPERLRLTARPMAARGEFALVVFADEGQAQ